MTAEASPFVAASFLSRPEGLAGRFDFVARRIKSKGRIQHGNRSRTIGALLMSAGEHQQLLRYYPVQLLLELDAIVDRFGQIKQVGNVNVELVDRQLLHRR